MARRKRMVYDPPGSRKRRHRGAPGSYTDRTFLSRRMFIAKGGVIAVFSALAARLGYLQLVQGDEYKVQAEENVIREEVIPAPRGIIRDRVGRPLARNRRSWEVRVVKAELPEDEAEQRRVLDMLISALQLEDVVVIRPSAVPSGSRDTVFQRVASMRGYDAERTEIEIARWKREWGDRLVRVAPVSIDEAALFRAKSAELPGVLVMNEIDYLVGNVWAQHRPITVKNNVPRDVALKLEANSMYMPGVIVDDIGLSREYLGGEVMAHVLGYVQLIDSASLDDLRNRDEHNERIYDQNDIIGKQGLEQALETQLRGVKGTRSVEVDAAGVVLRTVPRSEVAPEPGSNPRLTIDLELQQAVGRALEEGIARAAEGKTQLNIQRGEEGKKPWKIPNAGCAVAYDPRTGEVLAMVSYPYYDNQLFVTGISSRKWSEYTNPTRGKAFLNRATHEIYPPGSTFKIFLAASALEHGTITPDKTFSRCRGAIRVPNTWNLNDGTTMACWVGWREGGEHPELDLYGAIEQSCDVYFYNVAQEYIKPQDAFDPIYYWDWNLLRGEVISSDKHVFDGLGIDLLARDMQERFWFGRETGIEILDEATGRFPDPAWKQEAIGEGWAVGDTLNVSIGQGETQVTPLQLTMNTAALANGGSFKRPHLVRQWEQPDGSVESTRIEEMGILDIDREHLEVVTEGMRRVVHSESGTAHHSTVNDQPVTKWPLINPEGEEEVVFAGKTGTAEFGEEDDLGARDTHAWFTCFAPLENPEIAVSVVIEAGGEGSTYAVPVADAILRGYFELTGKRARGKVLSKEPLPVPGQDGATLAASPAATPSASPDASTPEVG